MTDPITMEMTDTYVNAFLIATVLCVLIPLAVMRWEDRTNRVRALKSVELPKGMEFISSRAAFAEAIEVVVAAWSGSEQNSAEPELLHCWMLAPSAAVGGNELLLRWMVRFYFGYARLCPGSVVLGVRCSDGTLAAVASVVPYLDGLPELRSQTDFFALRGPILGAIIRAMRLARARRGLGVLADESVKRRFDAACAVSCTAHQQACGSSRPHLHVGPLAVKPTAQGAKHASALLRHINHCADVLRVACFLECSGKRPRAIFTRFGYTPVGTKPLTVAVAQAPEGAIGKGGAGSDAAAGSFDRLWAMERDLQWPITIVSLNTKWPFLKRVDLAGEQMEVYPP